jgi:hypothetical protein
MYATYLVGAYWHVINVDQGDAGFVAMLSNGEYAARIAQLLERHGLVDVPLEQVEP